MNIWAFLFYTVVLSGLVQQRTQANENENDEAHIIIFLIEIIFISIFIFMEWYK